MGWFSDDSDEANSHSQFFSQHSWVQSRHEGSITHDLLAGAVAYEAAKKYEEHVAKAGKPDSHAKAKEILQVSLCTIFQLVLTITSAALAAAGATQLLETKAADAWDDHKRNKAAKQATEQLEVFVAQDYE
ncbi:hypothetical protein BS17DRAFT_768280 [Gyrodon lividus]|nr:hypothetical protein BS17DRAFT_768280 [Gyrodon lividus]